MRPAGRHNSVINARNPQYDRTLTCAGMHLYTACHVSVGLVSRAINEQTFESIKRCKLGGNEISKFAVGVQEDREIRLNCNCSLRDRRSSNCTSTKCKFLLTRRELQLIRLIQSPKTSFAQLVSVSHNYVRPNCCVRGGKGCAGENSAVRYRRAK